MIILHGALLQGRLFLWGEAAEAEEAEGKKRNGRARSRSAPASPYPFDAGFDVVSKAVRNLPVGFRPTRRRKQCASAWLPTRGSHPLPSSELVAEGPRSRAKIRIRPWLVDGLHLDPEESLDFPRRRAWQRSGSP